MEVAVLMVVMVVVVVVPIETTSSTGTMGHAENITGSIAPKTIVMKEEIVGITRKESFMQGIRQSSTQKR